MSNYWNFDLPPEKGGGRLCFPRSDTDHFDTVAWRLRYCDPDVLTREELLFCASVMGAYRQLTVCDTLRSSNAKLSAIRKLINEEWK